MQDNIPNCPKTVEETVKRLIGEIPEESLAHIKAFPNARNASSELHMSLGLYIRNIYIYSGCQELKDDCLNRILHKKPNKRSLPRLMFAIVYGNADACSTEIVQALWERLQQIE